MDDLAGVSIPELVVGSHPLRYCRVLWSQAIVPNGVRLLWYMSEFDGVKCCMKVGAVEYRGQVVVGDKRSAPDVEEFINNVV